ncbi:type II toxin-antitoxin system YafQ family toxin [Companilactobacillus allii]|uniref:Addiction module toxin RelE n=1 Tax=Companilactobacillus allii TaxID=1847728 RepID=A0A1P8Q2J3_9LACO|nr:type II toxin-antitoxin system YafQ family toxin [Companilactobacillus allii]APX72009.1 addiction module toxin RelE [Companilactobacillus allii]USQ69102.1 type II toxin-antitoxin system YafQ family toxin [Companilactobacillus allii]
MLEIVQTPTFVKDFKKLKKKHYNMLLLKKVVTHIVKGENEILVSKYRDHALKGNWQGFREVHIEKDWLLVYLVNKGELRLALIRTGSHSQILGK